MRAGCVNFNRMFGRCLAVVDRSRVIVDALKGSETMRARLVRVALGMILLISGGTAALAADTIPVLLIDGQNNHQWQIVSQVLKATLENSGRFSVDVVSTPAAGGDFSAFDPEFSKYPVVLSNYNGEDWPEGIQGKFVEYVRGGGGFVVFHAADNPFPGWAEYNEMIGLGGWGNRNEKSGPYVRWKDGQVVLDSSPGRGGSHGRRHEYVIDNRAPQHPIMKGIPSRWLHTTDELYDRLRGPAKNMEVLATAFSDKSTGGTGEDEPILWTVTYGEGKIFHTVLGDNLRPMMNVGFQVTLLRGTEWAATGKVTIPVPSYFPTETEARTADPFTPYAVDSVGWRALFNTKDLTGWEQVNGTAKYKVDPIQGEIIGTTAQGSPNSFLATVDEYSDFELRFEVMLVNPELNSGVQFRSAQYDDEKTVKIGDQVFNWPKGRVYGYQVEIEASRDEEFPDEKYGDAGFIYDEARKGWLSSEADRSEPARRGLFNNRGWNQYHVRCQGDHLETWINGVKVADVRDAQTTGGKIMLQVHQIPDDAGPWTVKWRNILVRPLN